MRQPKTVHHFIVTDGLKKRFGHCDFYRAYQRAKKMAKQTERDFFIIEKTTGKIVDRVAV